MEFDGVGQVPCEEVSEGGEIYDLQGRRVTRLQPGHIYVQKGMKILH